MIFEKYQGCGNDFIIVNGNYNSSLAKKLCNRHLNIGGDGLIVINDNKIKFYNADGSKAKICGNGLRCVGNYLFNHHLLSKQKEIICEKKKYIINKIDDDIYKIIFPLDNVNYKKYQINKYLVYLIDVGNKHCVLLNYQANEKIAKEIIKYDNELNVSFVKIINRKLIKVKTYERGVGFTLSCGSASLASSIILNQLNLVDQEINIKVKEGILKINLNKEYSLFGSSKFVYKGEINERI